MYDPMTARFLSKDPLEEQGGSPNLYLYCANDPVNKTDPSGQAPIPKWFGALSKQDGDQKVVAEKDWYARFGRDAVAVLLWEWLKSADEHQVTEAEILKIVSNTDGERNTDGKVAVYASEGAYRKKAAALQAYLAGYSLGTDAALQNYAGRNFKVAARDYDKKRGIFWVLNEPDEPDEPAQVAPAPQVQPQPAQGGQDAPPPVLAKPQFVPFEFDYHYADPKFVKIVPPRPPTPDQAAAEGKAEVIWNGHTGSLTSKGVEVAQYNAASWRLLTKRYIELQIRVKDLKKRYPREVEELEPIIEKMRRAYMFNPYPGQSVAWASRKGMGGVLGCDEACPTHFASSYLFSDQVEAFGERAYYLLRKMTGQVLDKPVRLMTWEERARTVWGLAVESGQLNAKFQEKIEAIITDPALYATAVGYALSHAIGLGEAADVVVGTLLYAKLGTDAFRIVSRVIEIIELVVNARADSDLEKAAVLAIEISLLAVEDVTAATFAARPAFQVFRSLRAELSALRTRPGGGLPTTGASSTAPSGSSLPTEPVPLPPGSSIPSGRLPPPRVSGPGGNEPPGLAPFVPRERIIEILPNVKPASDIVCVPRASTAPSTPSVPLLPTPAVVVAPGLLPTPVPAPKPAPKTEPEPPPKAEPGATDDDQNDECKQLTGFSKRKGPNPLQANYATEIRHVNSTTTYNDDPDLVLSFSEEEEILKTYNNRQFEVRVPETVVFRIDLTGDGFRLDARTKGTKPLYDKIPGTDGDERTSGNKESGYIDVTGRGPVKGAIRDYGVHVIDAKFGGKNAVGWLAGTKGWRSNDTNLFPGAKDINEKLFQAGLEKSVKR